MYVGKTLFAQVLDFLLWKTFHRVVARYGADQGVRTLNASEPLRVMAFAQITYRESLRDIEACPSAQAPSLCARFPPSQTAPPAHHRMLNRRVPQIAQCD